MDPVSWRPVFLLVVWFTLTITAQVAPPTNVTLHCHNLHNVLKWRYDQPSPGLRFKVTLCADSCIEPLWVDPPTLQVDLPIFSDPSYDYGLTLTAVIGQNTSEAAPPDGIIFSYFESSQESQRCFVDFPSVNVTAQRDDTVRFRFTHPWLLYHQKFPARLNPNSRKKRNHDAQIDEELPIFNYKVVIVQKKERHHDFSCMESVCEEILPVDAAQEKHCLKMTGELHKTSFHGTQKYCALPFEITPHGQNNNVYISVGIGMLALIAVVLVFVMVLRKKTKAPSDLPPSMKNFQRIVKQSFRPVPEEVIVAEVEPSSPTPLLPTTEEKELTPAVTPSTEDNIFMPIGVNLKDEDICDQDSVKDEGSEYMGGRNLDADETQYPSKASSGYEKREKVLVEVGPDEQAEGYRC